MFGRATLTGDFAAVPYEVALIVLQYCPRASVARLAGTCRGLHRLSFEAQFDKKLTAPRDQHKEQLAQLYALGLLREFPMDAVRAALATAKGNVEHARRCCSATGRTNTRGRGRGGVRGRGGH